MERLLSRVRALPRLRALSAHILPALLEQSDPAPERVSQGVILFQRGEKLHCWYLLLAGQVQLYLDELGLAELGPGTMFGELHPRGTHSCSARVLHTAEFVRIAQRHFLSVYNKCADQLQQCIVPMEDQLADQQQPVSNGTGAHCPNGTAATTTTRGEQHRRKADTERREGNGGRREKNAANGKAGQSGGATTERGTAESLMAVHSFELGSTFVPDERIASAAPQLRAAISGTDSSPLSGAELCSRLRALCAQWLPDMRQPFEPSLLQGMGQSLLDRLLLASVRADQPLFRNSSSVLYRWTVPPSDGSDPPLSQTLLLLCLSAADSLLQHTLLHKPFRSPRSLAPLSIPSSECDRNAAELELVNEELSHIRAFGHLSRSMRRALAKIVRWENREHAGTVIFREGDPGKSWFVVLRGTLEARTSRNHQKVKCIRWLERASRLQSLLHEGDDFGKLALLPNGPGQSRLRQSTVTTAEDGCQLLRVDADEFSRLLAEVEANTVRLRHFDGSAERDVLVLQRDRQGHHSLVAGLPHKILEYTLETRVDALPQLSLSALEPDLLLQDVLLSLPLWMPSNSLCNALKLYYSTGSPVADSSTLAHHQPTLEEWTDYLAAKRRTVHFVVAWQQLLGHRFFLDSVANAFVEELFSCVLEDARSGAELEMAHTVRQMEALMLRRESAMQRLSRRPLLVLDRGLYTEHAPAPSPVLPCDIANLSIKLVGRPSMAVQVRMDKSAAEIVRMARGVDAEEESALLAEVLVGGGRQQFEGTECSVATMLAPGSTLVVTREDQLDRLPLLVPDAPLPSARPLCLLLSPSRLASALALHHFKLLAATGEQELLVHVIGRDQFPPSWVPSNLDLLLRRFRLVQFWASTEVLLAPTPLERATVLRTLVELTQQARQLKDLLSAFAVVLGLSILPVSRLLPLWAQLPLRLRRQHAQMEHLLSPARNHRNYRLLAQILRPPFVPFIPLMLKELSFLDDDKKTQFGDGLVNFEKMHLIGQVLRCFRHAKGTDGGGGEGLEALVDRMGGAQTRVDEGLIRNLHAVEDQRRLMRLSHAIQQP